MQPNNNKSQFNASLLIITALIILLGLFNYFILNFKLNNLSITSFKIIENINSIKTQEK